MVSATSQLPSPAQGRGEEEEGENEEGEGEEKEEEEEERCMYYIIYRDGGGENTMKNHDNNQLVDSIKSI